jgi:cytochrome c peroxidase
MADRTSRIVVAGTRAVAVAMLLGLLALGSAASQEASGAEAVWRAMFKRPTDPPAPHDNPMTPEKVALGAKLFADTRLSGKRDRACVSCHQAERAFTDGRRRARGISGAPLRRNTPSLWNLAWGKTYFWDGRAPSLEAQVQMPIETADEMGGDWPTILRRLEEDADTVANFRGAFADPQPVTQTNVLKALATYVRSLVSPPTPFDAWIDGDSQVLSPAQQRGFRLFTGKGACVLCHVGWRFTDDKFHDIGLRSPDGGRGLVPGGTPGLMAFKTPSLRELTRTAPYMHDGSLATLADVVGHYTGRFVRRPSLAPTLRRDLRLSAQEKSDLIAFLAALSSEKDPTRRTRAGSP